MDRNFTPDYTNLVDAALNRKPARLPLYEHIIGNRIIETLTGKTLPGPTADDEADRCEHFRIVCEFCLRYGYDVVPFEGPVTDFVQHGQGLMGRAGSLVRTTADIEAFPWDELPERFFRTYGPTYEALAAVLPPGMKAVGGVGNGIFEVAQDFIPFIELCYLQAEDPEAYALLWEKVGRLMETIWIRFLRDYGDMYAVLRMGDDLGFQTSTLIQPDEIRKHIIPQYARIVNRVHGSGKPFLLHCCGNIFLIMDDLIRDAHIDAKHSNEDNIAPFRVWVERYGDRIGNFGGVDLNVLCLEDEKTIRDYVTDVCALSRITTGIAIGSGNSITDYTPPSGFIAMIEAVREYRKE